MKKALVAFLLSLSFVPCLRAEEFLEKKSTHFIVYYQGIDEEFVDTVIEYAERYYKQLNEKLGFTRFDYWTWDKRAKIYIYPDVDSYVKGTGQPAWSGGVAAYDQKTIWAYPREAGFFDSLLPHELGHIVFREVVGGSHRVPLWLEEGVAQYLEQAKRFGSEKMILDAIEKKTFIPFEELSKIDGVRLRARGGEDVQLYYAECVHIVNFLIEKFGPQPFNSLCRKLKEGRDIDEALGYAYFDVRNSRVLGEMWERSLRDKLKARAKVIR